MQWRGILMMIFGILVVAIPLLAPGFFIAIGMIAWPIVYLIVYMASIGHDLTNTIPWMVPQDLTFWPYLIILMLFGLVLRGPIGSVALLVAWGPFFVLPAFLVMIGMATVNEHGWSGYLVENYDEGGCQADWAATPNGYGKHPVYCLYSPKPGRNIPAFLTDENDNYVKTITD